jgi:hypothetical protein
MAGLGRRVDYCAGPHLLDQRQDTVPIPDIQFVMDEPREFLLQAPLVPPRVALGPEKYRPLVVVQTMHDVTKLAAKVKANF